MFARTGNGVAPFDFPANFPEKPFILEPSPLLWIWERRQTSHHRFGIGSGLFRRSAVAAGDQITFTRIRVTAGVPVSGDYTVYHPYGVETFQNIVAGVGNRDIVFSEDVGVARGMIRRRPCQPRRAFLQRANECGRSASWPVTIGSAQFLVGRRVHLNSSPAVLSAPTM